MAVSCFLMYFTPLSRFFLLSMSELFYLLYRLQEREAGAGVGGGGGVVNGSTCHRPSEITDKWSQKFKAVAKLSFSSVNRHYIFSFTFVKNQEVTARK